MNIVWRRTLQATLCWSAVARGQVPPPAPVPPPADAPAPPPTPPDSPPLPAPAAPMPAPPPGTAPLDQGPDELPSLDEEAPPPPPTLSPPDVAVVSAGTPRPLPPVRAERRLAVLGELGWNSLAGFGVNVAFHAHPRLTFELGVGLALVGGKVGFRTRVNFLDGPVTPFLGVGVMGATGFDAPTRDLDQEDDNRELNIKLEPSAFLQTVGGIDWTSRSGFTMIGALGYARLLTDDNVVIITGEPTSEERRAFGALFRSSAVVSMAIGYSFR
jgi:hypothetical protein